MLVCLRSFGTLELRKAAVDYRRLPFFAGTYVARPRYAEAILSLEFRVTRNDGAQSRGSGSGGPPT